MLTHRRTQDGVLGLGAGLCSLTLGLEPGPGWEGAEPRAGRGRGRAPGVLGGGGPAERAGWGRGTGAAPDHAAREPAVPLLPRGSWDVIPTCLSFPRQARLFCPL